MSTPMRRISDFWPRTTAGHAEAMPPRKTMTSRRRTAVGSLDDQVSIHQHCRVHVQADGVRCLKIDDRLKFRIRPSLRYLNLARRKRLSRNDLLDDLPDIFSRGAVQTLDVGSLGNQAAMRDGALMESVQPVRINHGQPKGVRTVNYGLAFFCCHDAHRNDKAGRRAGFVHEPCQICIERLTAAIDPSCHLKRRDKILCPSCDFIVYR